MQVKRAPQSPVRAHRSSRPAYSQLALAQSFLLQTQWPYAAVSHMHALLLLWHRNHVALRERKKSSRETSLFRVVVRGQAAGIRCCRVVNRCLALPALPSHTSGASERMRGRLAVLLRASRSALPVSGSAITQGARRSRMPSTRRHATPESASRLASDRGYG